MLALLFLRTIYLHRYRIEHRALGAIVRYRSIISGIATYLPGMQRPCTRGTGGTDSARYCYSVWLRHLVMAKNNGLNHCPSIVAELGPGDSLGVGLAALLSGSDQYFAFDVVEHATSERNLQVFDDLVALFENKADIPNAEEFPRIKPYLTNYNFPSDLLDDDRLRRALDQTRMTRIRRAINNHHDPRSPIQYKVPWCDTSALEEETVDMVYSQAVLEHVNDLPGTYRAMRRWLKPTGYISHQIDFKSHGIDHEWNGHWTYPDFIWRLIQGRRPFLINRLPHSVHLSLLEQEGFLVLCDKTLETKSSLSRQHLASSFESLSDRDLVTSGAFIQATRKAASTPQGYEPDFQHATCFSDAVQLQ